MVSRAWLGAGLLLVLSGGGCSVSNLTFEESLADFDAMARFEGTGEDQRVTYADAARLTPWYIRISLVGPLRPLVRLLLPGRQQRDIEPNDVRELIAQLAVKAEGDLRAGADAAERLARVVELDTSTGNRVLAMAGIGRLAAMLHIDLAAGIAGADTQPAPPRTEAVDTIRALRPAARTLAGRTLLTDEEAIRYTAALRELVARPLPQWAQRAELVADLATDERAERDAQLRDTAAAVLRDAIAHCLRWTVVRCLVGQDPTLAPVRLQAMTVLHRSGGPDAVPVILALLESPERLRASGRRIDPDPHVRLRLVHICGQLDAARANRVVLLPGRESWQAMSPVEFLASTVVEETSPLSDLRLPAQEALARVLGRNPITWDLDWVQAWYREHRKGT